MPKSNKVPTIEELLSSNPGIDPQQLTEFLEFHRLVGIRLPPQGITPSKGGKRLIIGDPDDDDSRMVRLRYSR